MASKVRDFSKLSEQLEELAPYPAPPLPLAAQPARPRGRPKGTTKTKTVLVNLSVPEPLYEALVREAAQTALREHKVLTVQQLILRKLGGANG